VNSGIYEIVHVASGSRYIGSAVKFEKRWRSHISKLRRGVHHTLHLQRAWTKDGESAFTFRKLLICSKENLIMYEQRAIDALNPEYNVCRTAGSCLGNKPSIETRAKIAASQMGNKHGAGHKLSPEACKKISELKRGKRYKLGFVVSAETRAKLSAAGKGYKHTLQARANMALAHKGKKRSPESLAKLSITLRGNKNALGNKASLETRKRMSAAQSARWASLRN